MSEKTEIQQMLERIADALPCRNLVHCRDDQYTDREGDLWSVDELLSFIYPDELATLLNALNDGELKAANDGE